MPKFLQPRHFYTDLRPIDLERSPRPGGLLFYYQEKVDKEIWDEHSDNFSFGKPEEYWISAFEAGLTHSYGSIPIDEVSDYFHSWPNTSLERWAAEYNSKLNFRWRVFYEAPTMYLKTNATCIGVPNVEWAEYCTSYTEALTMHKLESGINENL